MFFQSKSMLDTDKYSNSSLEESILDSVRNQHAQFELLTREQEEERQLISNKLKQFNKEKFIVDKNRRNVILLNTHFRSDDDDLSDVISIPSITSTNNDDLESNDELKNRQSKMFETKIDPTAKQQQTTDHYSYSYTYTTKDDPSVPGVSSVEVNESVTEEVGPDGTKIIRRHQQEKQINKVTQVVTQRVIKRQYIDPLTGKTIEYDPNDERFAHLPPETVFEEHTVRSNETPPPTQLINSFKSTSHFNNDNNINNNVALLHRHAQQGVDAYDSGTLNKQRTLPEDNKGYPEETNMDYDPDDVNDSEDPQYEGLVPESNTHLRTLNLDNNIYTPSSISPAETSNTQSNHINKNKSHNGSHSQLATSTLRSNFNNNGQSSPLLNNTHDYGMIPNHYNHVPTNGHNHYTDTGLYESRYSAIKQHDIDLLMRNMHLSNGNYSTVDYGYGTTASDQMNIYGTFNPHSNTFNRNIVGRQTFNQQHEQQQQYSPQDYRTRSPSIDSRIRDQGAWRNPDLEEVIEYLTHPSNEIKANAAAYLQHLCYQDNDTKARTRELGGIERLINLLKSDIVDVYKNACGALRNLSYGRNNDENKLEIRSKNGIRVLVNLLKRCTDENTRETTTAVLWNLSSCEEIKQEILDEGLNVLVQHIIINYAALDVLQNYKPTNKKSRLLTDTSAYPTVLTNTTGILRNCSSNLNFQSCFEARKKLRDCDELIRALLRIIDFAIGPHLDGSYRQLNVDSKCVENCMCILRNLSFRLQEIKDPNYDREVPPLPSLSNYMSENEKSKKDKKKKLTDEEFIARTSPYNMKPPQDGRAYELLWDLITLHKYLVIIKESTMRDTIEAAVGCIQNLTACYWAPSEAIRNEVRKAKCLPTLVFLMISDKLEDEPLVSVTSIALRNLAINAKNRDIIGKYAMKDLVKKLPDPNKPIRQLSILNEDTITAALACINECVRSNVEFVRTCVTEGGVTRMVFITRHSSQFPTKIVKYAAYVLTSMWKYKSLHELLKRDGYKESDFLAPAHSMGLKSTNSSPVNTLHRPRGDVKSSSNKTNIKNLNNSINNLINSNGSGYNYRSSNKSLNGSLNGSSNSQRNLINNDTVDGTPLYSQVQKNNVMYDNSNDRVLTVMKGAINADSWV